MRLCYYCGGSGHLIHRCPEKPSSAQVGENSLFFSLTVPVSLCFSDRFVPVPALIDSGAAVNLIDRALVEELRIPTISCMPSLRITAIDSQPIRGGYLTHQTHMTFYVTSSPANPVILGFPWLRQHDPQISWHKGELVQWSATCLSKCLHEPVPHPCLTSVDEDSASLASGHIPCVYEDFQEVFSREGLLSCYCAIDLLPNTSPPKGRVYPLSLPEARAMEEYIEEALAVGHKQSSTSPAAAGFFFVVKKDGGLHLCIDYRGLNVITVCYPYPLPLVSVALEQLRELGFFASWIYAAPIIWSGFGRETSGRPLFTPPMVIMSTLSCPSDLPMLLRCSSLLSTRCSRISLGSGLSRIWTTSWCSRPLWRNTSITSGPCSPDFSRITSTSSRKNVSSTGPLSRSWDMQGVEMDFTKVHAVTEWPNPTTVKELQLFLGFAKFYRRFIRNYSFVAGLLTSLLRGKPRRLSWRDQTQAAFIKLKDSFTMAPILFHPDLDLPFVVEVDASSSGIGAMLSQRHGVPGKLHPCAFFSRKLMAAEANYDVGNW
ncbi:hypothetical protein QTP86_007856 [Hemibagrus guttatus]|nr:hypothetical protein QTP86_007856 [Hemibagrus guttatus]